MPMIETLTPNEIAKMLKLHPFTVARLARVQGRRCLAIQKG